MSCVESFGYLELQRWSRPPSVGIDVMSCNYEMVL